MRILPFFRFPSKKTSHDASIMTETQGRTYPPVFRHDSSPPYGDSPSGVPRRPGQNTVRNPCPTSAAFPFAPPDSRPFMRKLLLLAAPLSRLYFFIWLKRSYHFFSICQASCANFQILTEKCTRHPVSFVRDSLNFGFIRRRRQRAARGGTSATSRCAPRSRPRRWAAPRRSRPRRP